MVRIAGQGALGQQRDQGVQPLLSLGRVVAHQIRTFSIQLDQVEEVSQSLDDVAYIAGPARIAPFAGIAGLAGVRFSRLSAVLRG